MGTYLFASGKKKKVYVPNQSLFSVFQTRTPLMERLTPYCHIHRMAKKKIGIIIFFKCGNRSDGLDATAMHK